MWLLPRPYLSARKAPIETGRERTRRPVGFGRRSVALAAIVSTLFCGIDAAPQSRSECGAAGNPPGPSYASFFGNQPSASAASNGLRIQLDSRARSQACPGSYGFAFTAVKKEGGTRSTFTLCNETAQVDEIDLVSDTRVLILGRIAANSPIANIVDLPSGALLDHFSCFMPAISPDHKFLAFLKSFSGHPGPVEISAVYLVYDLTQSPQYNRPEGADPGFPIYPPGAVNAANSNLIPQGQPFHLWRSRGLFWVNKDILAFANLFGAVNSLVLVHLTHGLKSAAVQARDIPTAGLIDLAKCRNTLSEGDLKLWQDSPSSMLEVSSVESVRPGLLCLRFVPTACLERTYELVRLDGE